LLDFVFHFLLQLLLRFVGVGHSQLGNHQLNIDLIADFFSESEQLLDLTSALSEILFRVYVCFFQARLTRIILLLLLLIDFLVVVIHVFDPFDGFRVRVEEGNGFQDQVTDMEVVDPKFFLELFSLGLLASKLVTHQTYLQGEVVRDHRSFLSWTILKVDLDESLHSVPHHEVVWSFLWDISISLFKLDGFHLGFGWGFSLSSCDWGLVSLTGQDLLNVELALCDQSLRPLPRVVEVVHKFPLVQLSSRHIPFFSITHSHLLWDKREIIFEQLHPFMPVPGIYLLTIPLLLVDEGQVSNVQDLV